jgi:hypothetical protein
MGTGLGGFATLSLRFGRRSRSIPNTDAHLPELTHGTPNPVQKYFNDTEEVKRLNRELS